MGIDRTKKNKRRFLPPRDRLSRCTFPRRSAQASYRPAKNFRSLGQWRSKRGLSHFNAALRETEIADDDRVVVQEEVRSLEIAVHHFVFVESSETVHDLLQVKQRLAFWKQFLR